jgi:hypothetical protein
VHGAYVADIKAQLPSEYARFKSIDTEFVNLMRKVAHKPNVLEVSHPRQAHAAQSLHVCDPWLDVY